MEQIRYRTFADRGVCLFFRNTLCSSYNHSIRSVYKSHNPKDIKVMTRLVLDLKHWHKHGFKTQFSRLINLLCSCGYEVKSTVHFYLHCILLINERSILCDTLRYLDNKLFDNNDSLLTNILLFGKEPLYINQNTAIVNATMKFIFSIKRFDEIIFIC